MNIDEYIDIGLQEYAQINAESTNAERAAVATAIRAALVAMASADNRAIESIERLALERIARRLGVLNHGSDKAALEERIVSVVDTRLTLASKAVADAESLSNQLRERTEIVRAQDAELAKARGEIERLSKAHREACDLATKAEQRANEKAEELRAAEDECEGWRRIASDNHVISYELAHSCRALRRQLDRRES